MVSRTNGLGARGGRVFRALGGTKLDPVRKELAIEAGRMADRLEHLDQAIAGEEKFLKLLHFRMRHELDDEGVVSVELVMDKALAEARQLQLAFERLVKDLLVPVAAEPAKKAEAPVDDIAARIAARREARAAAGS